MKGKALYIFTPGFAADENDTTCIPFLQQHCLSFKKLYPGIPVVIFAFQYPLQAKEYHWNGIQVVAFGGNDRKRFYRILLWWRVILQFLKLRNEVKPIGILSYWLTECALIGKVISKLFSLKHYTCIAGQDAKKSNRYVKLIRPDEKSLIAFSGFIQLQMQQNFGLKPAYIIPNGITTDFFEPLNTGERKISIIGVGSLIPLKNFELFIDVVERVSKQIQLDKVIIIGEGPERDKLQQLIESKRLEHTIELKGLMKHSEVLHLMNNSKILLHTSRYDGNAGVLHEALYAGCRVISTCPADPAPEENFYLLQSGNEIAEKIIVLLSGTKKPAKRILTNTADNSAGRLMQLFIST